MRYRPEIDGLRAVAVIAVVIYHAELQLFGGTVLTGGFVGVDVFFVISGYLISTLIYEELDRNGTLSLRGFYERRARRILPALLTVSLASLPFAWMLLLPTSLSEFAHSIVAALLFYANFLFFFSTSEYGAEWSLLKPLLHTWSLSVEEQFYLFFPLLAVALHRFKNQGETVLKLLAFLSLGFAIFAAHRYVNLNFYLLPSRIWELLAGVLVAHGLRRGPPVVPWAHFKLANLGLFLIIVPAFLFSQSTLHPSYPTILPVFGTVLLILFARPDEGIGRVLASRPFVAVGLISYSLYLWHYPAFAFLRLWQGEPSNTAFAAVIGMCLVLSWLTYLFVEQPFRNRNRISGRTLFRTLAYICVALGMICTVTINQKGNFGQFDHLLAVLPNYEMDNRKLQGAWIEHMDDAVSPATFREDTTKVLVVGNSHAKDMASALLSDPSLFPELSFRMYWLQLGCFSEDRFEVTQFYNSKDYVSADVVLIAPQYSEQRFCQKGDRTQSSDIKGLEVFLKQARRDGKQVVLASNTVEFPEINGQTIIDYHVLSEPPRNPAEVEALNARVNSAYFELRNRLRPEVSAMNEAVRQLAAQYGAVFLEKEAFICDDARETCTAFTRNGEKIFWDYAHFTNEGAAFFGQRIAKTRWLAPLYEAMGI